MILLAIIIYDVLIKIMYNTYPYLPFINRSVANLTIWKTHSVKRIKIVRDEWARLTIISATALRKVTLKRLLNTSKII